MTLPKYKDISNIKTVLEVESAIFARKKNLFELRLKRSSNQIVKPHLFLHIKRELAQLNFKKSLILNPIKES